MQQPGQASTSASSSPAHSPALSAQAPNKPKRQGSVKRTKSSSKLHAHSRTRSGARLNQLAGLGPSTQIHKGKDTSHKSKESGTAERGGDHSGGSTPPLKSKAEQEAEAASNEELSSLYCSLECQREDQARAAATVTATTSPLIRPTDPRRLSSASSTHSATSASPLNSFAAFPSHSHTSNDSLPGGLDFSTRRNSRGATYRPLSMSRTLSNDQGVVSIGSPAFGLGSSRGSSSSLVGLGDEERSASTERTFCKFRTARCRATEPLFCVLSRSRKGKAHGGWSECGGADGRCRRSRWHVKLTLCIHCSSTIVLALGITGHDSHPYSRPSFPHFPSLRLFSVKASTFGRSNSIRQTAVYRPLCLTFPWPREG